MLNRQDLVQLMKTVAKADPSNPVAYSFNGTNYNLAGGSAIEILDLR